MSTDLREAMREAVRDAPAYGVDAAAVIEAGSWRIHQRNRIAIGAAALAAAVVVVTAAIADSQHTEPDPEPADVVRLDLDNAVKLRPEIIASSRTTWRDAGQSSLEYDRFEGITADGLVLHSRYTNDHGFAELGLLDPRTGETDWLPASPAPIYEPIPLDLASDRLVLFQAEGNGHSVSAFDRVSQTWQRAVVEIPYGIEVHMPPRVIWGPDDRVYVGTAMEGEVAPLHWWSAPVPAGGSAHPEPALEGMALAWSGGSRLVADADGHVELSTPAGTRVITDQRPADCARHEKWPDAPPLALLAGDRPVVTYFCASGPLTVVYEGDRRQVQIAGATAVAGDERRLVITGNTTPAAAIGAHDPESSGTYLMDIEEDTLRRIDDGPWETAVALDAGLLLWNTAGPIESRSVYDVVWKVAPLE